MGRSDELPDGCEIRLLHDQKVPVRDGIRLSTDVFIPRLPGRHPAIVHRTPYESTAGEYIEWGVWWAQHGYAAIVQDVRGRYESEGVFYPRGPGAGEDGYDTLEWLASQPWCSGRVGTWGRSAGASVQWSLASLGSPHLVCMAPHVISDDPYADLHYVGGAFQLNLSLIVAIIFETNNAITQAGSASIFNNQRLMRTLPLIDLDVEAIGRRIDFYRDWLLHGTYDEYWKAASQRGRHDAFDIPIFQQGGWFDPYVEAILRQFRAHHRPGVEGRPGPVQRVLIGPWTHDEPSGSRLGSVNFGPKGYLSVREEELRWFDYWLYGLDNGIGNDDPIRLFVMGENEWRGEHEWPLARTEFMPFYLHSHGRANSFYGDGTLTPDPPKTEPPDVFDYDPHDPVQTVGGNHSIQYQSTYAEVPIVAGPVDQRPLERRDDVLVYTSDPLERDLEVTGPVNAILYAASSARDTDFTVKLVDVSPAGEALNLSEGIIRGRFRLSYESPELLERGEATELRIALASTSVVFKKGHRIRVDISSSNFPRFSRNLNTGEDIATGTRSVVAHQTILHSGEFPSHILLPVVPS